MGRDTARRSWLTTGQFARRSGLSHKALRLYDLSGLLPPADVDPATGYRRYHPDQLERARRISLLRQLDMPLATVAEVLAGTDEEAVSRLDRWWTAQEASMRSRRDAMGYLRTRLLGSAGPDPAALPVSLRDVPDTKIATIRREVDQASLVDTMLAAECEVGAHLCAAGAGLTGERWWVYHGLVTPDSEAAVEVCVPFTGTVDPAGEITIRVEPAHTEAYCTITRDQCGYPRIMAAYDAVAAWVSESGLPLAGPAREVYFADFDAIAGGDPFAHVAFPVQRS